MRVIGSNLQSRLSSGSSTLCRIFTLTTTGGSILRWTDRDIDLVFDGDTYRASKSMKVANISTAANGGVSTTNLEFFFDEDGITEDDVLRGEYDSAELKVSWVDWTYPEYGEIILLVGEISITQITNKHKGVFEVRGILNRGDQRIGQFYTPECTADLGDARCTKPLASFTASGTVTSAPTRTRIIATLTAPENGYFAFGVLTWTSGPNTGRSIELLSQINVGGPEQLVLALEMPVDPEAGDTFDVVAGCDKRRETCKGKFDNIANFRGYPFVPGNDTITDRLLK